MFHTKAKRQAVEKLKATQEEYQQWISNVTQNAHQLFEQRCSTAVKLIQICEDYLTLLANSPHEFDKSVAEYKVEYQHFSPLSHEIWTFVLRF